MAKCVNGTNTSTFVYGCDGIRHGSVVNGNATDFVLDNSMFVRELHSGLVKATYFMGQSGPAYRRDDGNGGTLRWYLYDGLGSVLGEVDPNGNITARRKYDVYGMTRAGSDAGTSKHKFVGSLGHPSEDETSLVYMQARYYDPATGRFITEDPACHGANWFLYCCDSPTNQVDPSGLASLQEQVQATAIQGGMLAAGGGGAVEAGQHMAEELGEVVAAYELEIAQWLDGGFSPDGVDIGEFVIKHVKDGIEITATDGFTDRVVFLDVTNKYEYVAGHIQGIHLDFQKGDWDYSEAWKQISLGMKTFADWQGR